MPASTSLSYKFKALIIVAFVAVILLTGSVISKAWNKNRQFGPSQSARHVSTPQSEQSPDKNRERVETELITVTKMGFEPTEIRRPAGMFFLQIDNRSERRLELRFDRQGRETIKSHTVDVKAIEWREELNLEPGEYLLSTPNNPNWNCRVTITAR